jgi:hypothetical protein
VSTPYPGTDNSLTVIVTLMTLAVVVLVAIAVLAGVGRQTDDLGQTSSSSGSTCQRYGDC